MDRGRRDRTVTCADVLLWTYCLVMACKRSGVRIPIATPRSRRFFELLSRRSKGRTAAKYRSDRLDTDAPGDCRPPGPRRHHRPDRHPPRRRHRGGQLRRTPYACGRMWARQAIDVSIVAASVQLSKDGKLIRVHPIRHDRSRELGAFANPKGRPRRKNSAAGNVA